MKVTTKQPQKSTEIASDYSSGTDTQENNASFDSSFLRPEEFEEIVKINPQKMTAINEQQLRDVMDCRKPETAKYGVQRPKTLDKTLRNTISASKQYA